MRLAVWIVTHVTPTNPQDSVHFVCASSHERARDLVARRTGLAPSELSVVCLHQDTGHVPEHLRRAPGTERYLGPLEQFSPYLMAPCAFCAGTGKVLGFRPPKGCPTCGGTGMKKTTRA